MSFQDTQLRVVAYVATAEESMMPTPVHETTLTTTELFRGSQSKLVSDIGYLARLHATFAERGDSTLPITGADVRVEQRPTMLGMPTGAWAPKTGVAPTRIRSIFEWKTKANPQ